MIELYIDRDNVTLILFNFWEILLIRTRILCSSIFILMYFSKKCVFLELALKNVKLPRETLFTIPKLVSLSF